MNLLLDTHILLWAASGDKSLPQQAETAIMDSRNTLWFSVASLWEVAIKSALNRPDFQVEAGVLRAGLLANGYVELTIEGRHVMGLSSLPRLHNDPFDRLLIAQAVSEGMMLLTADRQVGLYSGPILRA